MSGDLENGRIRILAKNLEKFGEYTNEYDFDEFGKEVLEELGKVIIAKPSNFRTMGRHQEALRTSPTRPPRTPVEPAHQYPAEPSRSPVEDSGDPTKSFFGSIKSILRR